MQSDTSPRIMSRNLHKVMAVGLCVGSCLENLIIQGLNLLSKQSEVHLTDIGRIENYFV